MHPVRSPCAALVLPAVALVWAGCAAVVVSRRGYTPVYGDYGYVGPWDGSQVQVAGGYFVAPPFAPPGRGPRREESRRPVERMPEQGRATERRAPERRAPERRAPESRPAPTPPAASVQRAPSRAMPSIPNNPRPERRRNSNDKNRR